MSLYENVIIISDNCILHLKLDRRLNSIWWGWQLTLFGVTSEFKYRDKGNGGGEFEKFETFGKFNNVIGYTKVTKTIHIILGWLLLYTEQSSGYHVSIILYRAQCLSQLCTIKKSHQDANSCLKAETQIFCKITKTKCLKPSFRQEGSFIKMNNLTDEISIGLVLTARW